MMRKSSPSLLLLPVLLLLGACSGIFNHTLGNVYPDMYANQPTSILVLPPVNNTTAADAREYFSCSLAEALGLRGYYILPVETMFNILRDEGLYNERNDDPAVLANFKKYFGADAVLYTVIEKWDKSWFLDSGSLTIQARFALISTSSFETIWDYRTTIRVNLGSDSKKFLVALIESAVKTVIEDYFPNAREANILTFEKALPYGKYHPAQDLLDRVTLGKEGVFPGVFIVIALKREAGVAHIDIDEDIHDLGEAEAGNLGIGRRRHKHDARRAMVPELLSRLGMIGVIIHVDIAPESHIYKGVFVYDAAQLPHIRHGKYRPWIEIAQLRAGCPAAGKRRAGDPADALGGISLPQDMGVGIDRTGQQNLALQIYHFRCLLARNLVRGDLDYLLIKKDIHPL
jgi:hypothetical protein